MDNISTIRDKPNFTEANESYELVQYDKNTKQAFENYAPDNIEEDNLEYGSEIDEEVEDY